MKREAGEITTLDYIKDNTINLLFAAHDTVCSAATSLLICLFRYPEVRNKLFHEMNENGILDKDATLTFDVLSKMKYLNNVIKEVLRHYPPVPFGTKTAKRTFKLGVKYILSANLF